jgi:predicted nucleic acid-binding protein
MKQTLLLVTDSNIWTDLNNGSILDIIVKLPYKFITSDFVAGDMHISIWKKLDSLGIEAYVIGSDQILEISIIKQKPTSCSIPDLAAYVLAKELDAILLSGDKALRVMAENNNIEVHGVLWVLDQLVDAKILPGRQAATALEKMLVHNAYLPLDECNLRFKRWRAA